jgi:hypothetical protein
MLEYSLHENPLTENHEGFVAQTHRQTQMQQIYTDFYLPQNIAGRKKENLYSSV